jgi:hypothetical protein
MMELFKFVVFNSILIWLITQEDFMAFNKHESFKSNKLIMTFEIRVPQKIVCSAPTG